MTTPRTKAVTTKSAASKSRSRSTKQPAKSSSAVSAAPVAEPLSELLPAPDADSNEAEQTAAAAAVAIEADLEPQPAVEAEPLSAVDQSMPVTVAIAEPEPESHAIELELIPELTPESTPAPAPALIMQPMTSTIVHSAPAAPAAAPTAALTPAIDIVTGTIGGVGKTQFAHLLTGYYFNQMLLSGSLRPIHLVEGDHKGTKFHQTYKNLPAPFNMMVADLHQTVLSDDPAKQSNADFMAELALSSTAPIVINTPANSAEAMTDWLVNTGIPELCQEAGIPLRYWFVCRNTKDSLNAFIESFTSLGDAVPHILVKNQFAGQSQQGDWELPGDVAAALVEDNTPVLSMPSLYVQNQLFSERFALPFEVARAYDPESFSYSYWAHRLEVGDPLIVRWMDWSAGGTIEEFLPQWQSYWQAKGLLYIGSNTTEKFAFMKQHDLPMPSVGRNRLNKFLSPGYSSIAELGL